MLGFGCALSIVPTTAQTSPAADAVAVITVPELASTSGATAGLGRDAAGTLYWGTEYYFYRLGPTDSFPQNFYSPINSGILARSLYVTANGTVLFTATDHTIRRVWPNGTQVLVAGTPGQSGHQDGPAGQARFNSPHGIAVDAAGNILVADEANHVIRRIAPDGTVSTLAGRAGFEGSADGVGDTARFRWPRRLALDAEGNLYLSEQGFNAIRRITPAGVVTTYAGSKTLGGTVDGPAATARFNNSIAGLAVGSDGSLYVLEFNRVLRRVSPEGMVSTVAGVPAFSGSGVVNGVGDTARINDPRGLAADTDGTLLLGDGGAIRRVLPPGFPFAPLITTPPQATTGAVGGSVVLTVTAFGTPAPSYSWRKNGNLIAGAGGPTLTLANLTSADAADYSVVVSNNLGSVTSAAATLTIIPAPVNDAFAARAALTGTTPSASVSFIGATRESGEPAHQAGGTGSLWWTWTAPSTGFVTIDATMAQAGTTLKVYTGTAVNALTPVSPAPAYSHSNGAARLTFAATAGTAYQIALESADTPPGGLARLSIGYAYIVTAIAGDSTNWYGGNGTTDGTGAEARFNTAHAIVRDSSGNFFITDSSANTIRKMTPAGVVTTFAGSAVAGAYLNGAGTAARFNQPQGIAINASNTLYVADSWNHSIRQISPAGVVSLLAGGGGEANSGLVNSSGASARFNFPTGVAVDSSGNIYVTDMFNHVIRRVTAAGAVTTYAGSGTIGLVDGTGTAAQLNSPNSIAIRGTTLYFTQPGSSYAVLRVINLSNAAVTTLVPESGQLPYSARVTAVDAAGNAYLADPNYYTSIYRVSPQGVVSRIVGNPYSGEKYVDGDGLLANSPGSFGLTLDPSDNLWFTAQRSVRRAQPTSTAIAPMLHSAPVGGVIAAGTPITLSVRAYGGPTMSYQWSKDNTPIPGATDPDLVFPSAQFSDSASYSVTVSNPSGTLNPPAVDLFVLPAPGNDAFAQAEVLGGSSASSTSYNYGATRETNEPVLHANAGGRTLWWKWTAPQDGVIVADTAGSEILNYLGAYQGATLGSLTQLAFGTSGANSIPSVGLIGDAARVNVEVLAGQTYYFLVDAQQSAQGVLRLNINYASTVTNFAGATSVAGSADGTGGDARLSGPSGLARDSAGNLYVAETNNRTVRKITPAGVVTTLAGSPGPSGTADGTGSEARFTSPRLVTLDPDGNLYVIDQHAVRRITPAGVVTTLAGVIGTSGAIDGTGADARFSNPNGIAYGPDGAVYVADSGNRAIRRVTAAGVVTTFAGALGQSGLVDAIGAAARFQAPSRMTATPDGNLLVVEGGNRTLRRVNLTTAEVTTVLGHPNYSSVVDGVGDKMGFSTVNGLAYDAAGNLYVTESGNTVRRITPEGLSTVLAGLRSTSGSTLGTGAAARFTSPQGIVVADDGTLYVADSSLHVVRRLAPSSATQASVIQNLPTNQSVLAGAAVTFTVGYYGAPAPSFVWRRDGNIVATTSTGTLTLAAAQLADAGSYTVELTNSAGTSGQSAAWTLGVTAVAVNNNFADRIALTGASVQTTGNNFSATSEPGEPLHFEGEANRSVWWSWTAPTDGYFVVDSVGSSFAAMVAVYTGNTLGTLAPVGSGLDRVIFTATAGTAYQIAVDGRAGATGTISLRVQPALVAVPFVSTPAVPTTVVQDESGNVWFTAADHVIRRVTPAGEMTVVAGSAGVSGTADGVGTAARFNNPQGLARAADGTLFVSDTGNHSIRRIATDGTVTTLAGLTGTSGNATGIGSVARFNNPRGLAFDAAGENLYIVDSFNRRLRRLALATAEVFNFSGSGSAATSSIHDGFSLNARYSFPIGIVLAGDGNFYVTDQNMYAIRRVAPNGDITTLTGQRFFQGSLDGGTSVARFQLPQEIALDASGNLLVADMHGVRRVSLSGEVVTILGQVIVSGQAEGLGEQARFSTVRGLVGAATGGYLADSANQRLVRLLGTSPAVPVIAQPPAARTVFTGENATFSVTAYGMPSSFTYAWTHNDTPVEGATGPTLTLSDVTLAAAGDYRVTVTNTAGSVESAPATLTVTARPTNDAFAAAVQLSGATPSFTGTNAGATREPGEPLIAGQTGGASVWFRWTAPASGAVIADTAGSAFNALVGIYTGTAFANLAPQTTAVPVTVGSTTRPTAAMFTAIEGTTYWIAVDTAYGTTGDLVLHLSFTYNFSTLAGLAGSSGTTNGIGTAARFNRLNASAPDGLGNIYVADLNNHAIRKVAADGTVTTLAGLPGTSGYVNSAGTSARFNSPAGIVVGPDGNIYVADANNHAIRRITPGGAVTTFAGATSASSGTTDSTGTSARFNGPVALAFDSAGNLYVAEFGNHAVRKITSGGVVTTVAGLKGTSGAVNANGTAARFNTPEGVAVDSSGNIYVADFYNHAIRKIAPNGDVTTVAGQLGGSGAAAYVDGPAATSKFNGPNGVTALPDGSLLVADYYNHALRKITPAGYVLTLAGGNGSGHVNGTGLGIKFNGPSQIAFDTDGRLYVADQLNHVLRRGIITSAPAAPEITLQPQSIRIIAGSNITLTSGAIGNPFPAYQWRKNGTPIDGATSASLTLTNVQPADSGSYTVVATNANGSATSEAATVEILPLPANDSFNTRARVLGSNVTLSTYNFAATAQPGEPAHGGTTAAKSVWFTWTAPASGDVYLDTIGSTFDTRLALYDGDTLGTLRLIGENVSAPGAKFSKLRFTIAAGSTVHIAVDGVGGASGDFKLNLGYNFAFALHAGATNTPGSANGSLSQARFNGPTAMASDAAGNLYIADAENHVIRRITPAGIVSTFAGTVGSSGSTNGVGGTARFNRPFGIAADNAGNLYVADTSNHTVRKIVISSASVSTLAGTAGSTGTTDGTGAAARFNTPVNVACDAAGNVYVTDYSNRTIRKITPAGVVTTFAGTPNTVGNSPIYFNTPWGIAVDAAGNVYVSDSSDIRKITPAGVASYFVGNVNSFSETYADGAGTAALFNRPAQLAIDPQGNLYVADQLNHVIRQVTPTGEVRTLGGNPGEAGHLNGTANDAYFAHPTGIAIDAGGYLYVGSASMHIVTVGLRQAGPRAPFITTQPADQAVAAGGTASFVVVAAGEPAPTYQWRKNTVNIPGATSPVLTLSNISAGDAANYDVVITNALGSVASRAAALTLATAPTNDAFANAAALTGTSATATAFPTLATAEGGEPAHAGAPAARSLWWTWTAPANGAVIAETTGSAVDTRLAVYAGATLNSLALVTENDDATANGASRVQFDAVAGTTYRFAVDVNGSGTGSVRLALDYAFVVTTFAGSGQSGATDATGIVARFNSPYRVATDSAGNVYVADSLNHTIRRITPAGAVTIFAGLPGVAGNANGTGTDARFNTPTGIAIDALDRVFVTDAGNHTIRMITSARVVTTLAGFAGSPGSDDGTGAAARFNTPLDIALDPVTNGGSSLIVADFGNHTIRRVTNTGVVTTIAGSALQNSFADGTGAAARFNAPRGVAVDGSAVIYVADTGNHTLRRVTSAGVTTTLAGFPGSAGTIDGDGATARFSSPMDLAVDAAGRLLITQTGGGALRRRATDGTVTTVAGGTIGSTDATALAASFDAPVGVTLLANGTGYLADYNNHKIRQLTPSNLAAAPQTITFNALPDVAFTANPITLTATSTSGLTVGFEVVSGEAEVSGNQLTLLGTGSITIRATQPGNASWLAAAPVERTFNVTASFSSWLVDNFTPEQIANTSLTGPNADFDGDGYRNLVEYALGLDPKVAGNAATPEVAASASEWTFTYTRPADRTDVTYVVEVSTNLTAWTTTNVTHELVGGHGGVETWRASYPQSAASTLFFRLRVSSPAIAVDE